MGPFERAPPDERVRRPQTNILSLIRARATQTLPAGGCPGCPYEGAQPRSEQALILNVSERYLW